MATQPRPLAVERSSNPGNAPLAVRDQSWKQRAACRGVVTRTFDPFDIPYTMDNPPPEAMQYCGTCPVKKECLEDALWYGSYGVRAGLTQKQRDSLLRYRLRRVCPACRKDLPIPVETEGKTAAQVCVGCGRSWLAERRRQNEYEELELTL